MPPRQALPYVDKLTAGATVFVSLQLRNSDGASRESVAKVPSRENSNRLLLFATLGAPSVVIPPQGRSLAHADFSAASPIASTACSSSHCASRFYPSITRFV